MKRQQKDAFQIKLEKEARKYIAKIVLPVYCLIFFLIAYVGKASGKGILYFIKSQIHLIFVFIALAILFRPFLWFFSKSDIKSKVQDKMFEDISKALVGRMLKPGIPVEVGLIKPRDTIYGDFVLNLQYDTFDFYAVLGEKDNLILIYAVLKGDDKKRQVDIISKGEFSEYYQLLETSE